MNRKDRRAAGNPPMGVDEARKLLGEAVSHHQAGRPQQAGPLYDRVLAAFPNQPDALHLSGILLAQIGRPEQGIERLRRAVAAAPDRGEFHTNLGQALVQSGKNAEAETELRKAIALDPRQPDAHNNLGNLLKAAGQTDAAEACFRQAIKVQPKFAGAWNNLGNLLGDTGRTDEAIAALRKACELAPDFAGAFSNLGGLLADSGAPDEGEAMLRHALELAPNLRAAHEHLGTLCHRTRRYAEAGEHFRSALENGPDDASIRVNLADCDRQAGDLTSTVTHARKASEIAPERVDTWLALGVVLRAQGELGEAEDALRRALDIDGNHAGARAALGWVLDGQGRLTEAIDNYRQSLNVRPDHANTAMNLGVALINAGHAEEGLDAYARALEIDPDSAVAGSNLLMGLNYRPFDHRRVMEAHEDWAAHHASGLEQFNFTDRDRDPDRPLRIGVASPDLRTHSIAFFFESLLANIDQQHYPVTCYAEVRRPDAITDRLKALAQGWVDTVPLDDDALAARIHDDGTDILLDLAGHTRGNRLPALAHKPAPLQALWLGAPDTSGMAQIDYRVTDPVGDPPGETEHWHREKLVRIATGLNCYVPDATAPDVAENRAQGGRPLTFTSFNNWSKVGPETIDLWARVLKRVEGSHLFLKAHALADETIARDAHAAFEAHGISAGRIRFSPWEVQTSHHLDLYNQCDIALDTWPYSGHTTTCEALWMGVPVITMTGDRMGARVSASILQQVGLSGLVADDPESFAEIATALAADTARQEDLHRNLRKRMAASPLCDGAAFARNFEDLFRTMWRRWCAGDAPDHFTVG